MPDATRATLVVHEPAVDDARLAAAGFLAGYRGRTRESYASDLRIWSAWCTERGLAVLEVTRAHIELFARWEEQIGKAPATVARRLSVLAAFYRYCEVEGYVPKSPATHVRRPKVDMESTTLGLDRNELGAYLVQAGLHGGRDHALSALLALNGLRVSEACNADVEGLGVERGHRTLKVTRKGGKVETIPLAPRTARAIDLVVGERCEGPLLLGRDGERLDRHAAGRIVRRLARRAGITKRVGPHSLRHSFVTACLDAGVELRHVQVAAAHADPRTTARYDRGRRALDGHPTYIVAAFVAGAA